MPRKGHTDEQIIAPLRQYEAGGKSADICRKLGVSQARLYNPQVTWVRSSSPRLACHPFAPLRLRVPRRRSCRRVCGLQLAFRLP